MTMPAEMDTADQKAVDQVKQQAAEAADMAVMAVMPNQAAQAEAEDTVLMAVEEDNI